MQVSSRLRRGATAYFHWCPGCEEMHPLPDGWRFDGNLESPTFHPSFKHTMKRFPSYDARGVGVGEPFEFICHYNLLGGKLMFCADSSHALKGQTVPLPELPPHVRD